MEFKIEEIFLDDKQAFMLWKRFVVDNLIPFPVQMKFLLNYEDVINIIESEDNVDSPTRIRVFGVYAKKSMLLIATLILSFQYDDDSAEITHFVIDSKYRKTYISGKIIYLAASFVSQIFKENNIDYAQSSVPVENSNLGKIFAEYGWKKKAILNSYQKVEEGNKKYRRDVIYFECINN
jgi:hypothetical protein